MVKQTSQHSCIQDMTWGGQIYLLNNYTYYSVLTNMIVAIGSQLNQLPRASLNLFSL